MASPGDQIRENLVFYGAVATQELLVFYRDPWRLEFYRLTGQSMHRDVTVSVASGGIVRCNAVPIDCLLTDVQSRTRLQVTHRESNRSWTI